MVVVRIVGGLGNQMFQYACGRAISRRSNSNLLLDVSVFSRYKQHRYGLGEFMLEAKQAPWYLTSGGNIWAALRKIGINNKQCLRLGGFSILNEHEDLSFRPDSLGIFTKVYLDGYWQNESYFKEEAALIRADFQLRSQLRLHSASSTLMSDGLANVSLHVRRGDYVTNSQANATHGVLGAGYYADAVKLIEKGLGKDFRLVVFSDDAVWARENLKFSQPMHFVAGNTEAPHIDLHLMAMCDHHIIANSSFSWWGAWLNASNNKIVIAPKNWFRTQRYATADFCPAKWLRV
ncbi:MAG: hypothetical protein A2W28_12295 [Gammaproteobacteria bacterium RBG_16_51_14]|nr:MAG: hypothetical protein A2W28_12295 [Gammaproteobacteria bacterium RBG_16_51_14]